MTALEITAWKILRTMEEQRFRRQVPFDEYILDFYSPRYKLCVEIDGPLHDQVRDAVRDQRFSERGIKTLRFAEDNLGQMESTISKACESLRPRFRQSNPVE